MPDPSVTRILNDSGDGAADALLPLVYEQLRRIAQQRMADERGGGAGHTLQATALVHEAYVRLVGDEPVRWEGRGHFFAAAAEAMRRILIEHARAKGRVKRGGGSMKLPLDVVDLAASEDSEQIMSVEEAFRRLEARDARLAQVVRLRFFAGLSNEQTAEVLGLNERTVRRDWDLARAVMVEGLGTGD